MYLDIVWNNKSKIWEFPKNYGSTVSIKSVKEVVCYSTDKRIENLICGVRNYPHTYGYGRAQYRSKAQRFAYILWLAGVEDIVIGNSNYLPSYEQKPENVLVNTFSFECRSYITFPFTNGRPFLFWMLDKANMRFSGCADNDRNYMQASFSDNAFITEMVLYFMALKDQFKTSKEHYKNK